MLYTLLHDEYALRSLPGGNPNRDLQPCERGLHPKNEAQFNVPKFCEAPATAGYSTGIIGKWHLGDDKSSEPSGFDHFDVLLGQGHYHDSAFNLNGKLTNSTGYVTDVITTKSVQWLETRDVSKPFFLMVNHKPLTGNGKTTRNMMTSLKTIFGCQTLSMITMTIGPRRASAAKIRIREDLKYDDLGLIQPEGGVEVGQPIKPGARNENPRPKRFERYYFD